jgi:hypothetical protein
MAHRCPLLIVIVFLAPHAPPHDAFEVLPSGPSWPISEKEQIEILTYKITYEVPIAKQKAKKHFD